MSTHNDQTPLNIPSFLLRPRSNERREPNEEEVDAVMESVRKAAGIGSQQDDEEIKNDEVVEDEVEEKADERLEDEADPGEELEPEAEDEPTSMPEPEGEPAEESEGEEEDVEGATNEAE
ncbi:MAG: hypothetical protein IKG22_07345, partial [Atopobiaceae bacterium]|nr:hypothetical protein [Atopobiaceae bacterium]